MSGAWTLFKRLVLIGLGSLLGSIAALVMLLIFAREKFAQVTAGRGLTPELLDTAIALVRESRHLFSGTALLPALLVVVIGEVARIRTSAFYVVGGGLALAAMPFLARVGSADGLLQSSDAVWKAFATAGFVAGLAYWLVAGRRA